MSNFGCGVVVRLWNLQTTKLELHVNLCPKWFIVLGGTTATEYECTEIRIYELNLLVDGFMWQNYYGLRWHANDSRHSAANSDTTFSYKNKIYVTAHHKTLQHEKTCKIANVIIT